MTLHALVSHNFLLCNGRNGARLADLGELDQSGGHGFHHDDAVNLSRSKLSSSCLFRFVTTCNHFLFNNKKIHGRFHVQWHQGRQCFCCI